MKRGFYHSSKAYYAESAFRNAKYKDEVIFGLYHEGGGTTGEMAVKWYKLIDNEPLIARLECFEDTWLLLSQFKDVTDEMAKVNRGYIQPDEFCQILIKCGFEDLTPIERE